MTNNALTSSDKPYSISDKGAVHEAPPASAYIVVDTNFLLLHLTLIESIQAWHSKYRHIILLPWVVIEECIILVDVLMIVDGLKGSLKKNNGKSVGTLAREAIRWAQDALQSDNRSVVAQAKTETTEPDAKGDDAVLTCCLY
jgi:hypothetical protein